MGAWSTNLFDSDGMQSAFVDLLESPNPHDVVQEAAVLANSEPGDLDEAECYSVLAAAAMVDHLIYNTPIDAHAEGVARLEDEHGPTEFIDLRSDLARALARVTTEGNTVYEDWRGQGDQQLRAWLKPITAMQQRLAGEYHGSQGVVGEEEEE